MNHHKSFSLSLQKEMGKRNLSMDCEINKTFKELKVKSLLRRSGIMKQKGYQSISLLYLLVLLPFLKKSLSCLWLGDCFLGQMIV